MGVGILCLWFGINLDRSDVCVMKNEVISIGSKILRFFLYMVRKEMAWSGMRVTGGMVDFIFGKKEEYIFFVLL